MEAVDSLRFFFFSLLGSRKFLLFDFWPADLHARLALDAIDTEISIPPSFYSFNGKIRGKRGVGWGGDGV